MLISEKKVFLFHFRIFFPPPTLDCFERNFSSLRLWIANISFSRNFSPFHPSALWKCLPFVYLQSHWVLFSNPARKFFVLLKAINQFGGLKSFLFLFFTSLELIDFVRETATKEIRHFDRVWDWIWLPLFTRLVTVSEVIQSSTSCLSNSSGNRFERFTCRVLNWTLISRSFN